jgi:hypothetical protein
MISDEESVSEKVVIQSQDNKYSRAPRRRTLSRLGLKNAPLIGGLCLQRTSTKCGPKCAPHRRTLSHPGLRPNVVQNVPLVGGLCLIPDFDQMWPNIAPLFGGLRHIPDVGPDMVDNAPLIGGLRHISDVLFKRESTTRHTS